MTLTLKTAALTLKVYGSSALVALITLIIIAVSLIIMLFKDNALQDWLERTLFGTLDGHTYDPKQEQAEYDLALAELRG